MRRPAFGLDRRPRPAGEPSDEERGRQAEVPGGAQRRLPERKRAATRRRRRRTAAGRRPASATPSASRRRARRRASRDPVRSWWMPPTPWAVTSRSSPHHSSAAHPLPPDPASRLSTSSSRPVRPGSRRVALMTLSWARRQPRIFPPAPGSLLREGGGSWRRRRDERGSPIAQWTPCGTPAPVAHLRVLPACALGESARASMRPTPAVLEAQHLVALSTLSHRGQAGNRVGGGLERGAVRRVGGRTRWRGAS